ncbi:hypothetical protein TRICHSKD4_0044 [Roseibium sp. TrichSKD4]|nr:hypothetical protein TRICHSKD4_0044 [Roseibium sp. TrichSKD4]
MGNMMSKGPHQGWDTLRNISSGLVMNLNAANRPVRRFRLFNATTLTA